MAPLLARLGLGRSGFGFGRSAAGPSGPSFSATGGTIITNGSYTYHIFLSPGSFVVSSVPGTIDYLVVAGGGGSYSGAGGGAGGVLDGTSY